MNLKSLPLEEIPLSHEWSSIELSKQLSEEMPARTKAVFLYGSFPPGMANELHRYIPTVTSEEISGQKKFDAVIAADLEGSTVEIKRHLLTMKNLTSANGEIIVLYKEDHGVLEVAKKCFTEAEVSPFPIGEASFIVFMP